MEMIMQSLYDHYWVELKRRDSLFTDWASVARYSSYVYQKAIKEGERALKPVVEGWIQGLDNPQERLKAITQHVQRDFRLVRLDYVDLSPDSFDVIIKDKVAAQGDEGGVMM